MLGLYHNQLKSQRTSVSESDHPLSLSPLLFINLSLPRAPYSWLLKVSKPSTFNDKLWLQYKYVTWNAQRQLYFLELKSPQEGSCLAAATISQEARSWKAGKKQLETWTKCTAKMKRPCWQEQGANWTMYTSLHQPSGCSLVPPIGRPMGKLGSKRESCSTASQSRGTDRCIWNWETTAHLPPTWSQVSDTCSLWWLLGSYLRPFGWRVQLVYLWKQMWTSSY